ncbi:MAG: N-acetylhexosamine 1-kinase [Fimbriimonadaceae bacterium]|nr:N-acetylhexosamine 1-kinase [Fimbriimonadaceae bacterium]
MSIVAEQLPPGIFEQFDISGAFAGSDRLAGGHINRSYLVAADVAGKQTRFVFQRINRTVFPRPDLVMDNIDRVTRHLAGDGAVEPWRRHTLTVVSTRSGETFFVDPEEEYWRAYYYVEDCRTFDVVENEHHAREAGRAFGAFIAQMKDFSPELLHETIANFHHTPTRIDQLRTACEVDVEGRARDVGDELTFVFDRVRHAEALVSAISEDQRARRVSHNDCKINNVLFDRKTDRATCVIDLDTVMPGTALYDFGDLVRTVCGTAREDERDLDLMEFDLPNFEALLDGYVAALDDDLVEAERRRFAIAGLVITLEIGTRFLADHLNGDRYFRIQREGHNLDRARTQFKLVSEMENRWADITGIAERITGSPQLR